MSKAKKVMPKRKMTKMEKVEYAQTGRKKPPVQKPRKKK